MQLKWRAYNTLLPWTYAFLNASRLSIHLNNRHISKQVNYGITGLALLMWMGSWDQYIRPSSLWDEIQTNWKRELVFDAVEIDWISFTTGLHSPQSFMAFIT